MVSFLNELLLQELPNFVLQKDRVELFFHLIERSEKGMENVSMVIDKNEIGNFFKDLIKRKL